MLKFFIKKNKKIAIQGRIVGGHNYEIFVYICGFVFGFKPKKLNMLCNSKQKKKRKKNKYFSFNFIRATRIIKCYKLRSLFFEIDFKQPYSIHEKKPFISRVSYVEKIKKKRELDLKLKEKKRELDLKLKEYKLQLELKKKLRVKKLKKQKKN